mmetsp:Transcript_128911/g.412825  ORF Transcript_128911/g.412825 Transcript_128911/m.412825 type:complete len:293 (+) Transcript_128911:773-1651(+)
MSRRAASCEEQAWCSLKSSKVTLPGSLSRGWYSRYESRASTARLSCSLTAPPPLMALNCSRRSPAPSRAGKGARLRSSARRRCSACSSTAPTPESAMPHSFSQATCRTKRGASWKVIRPIRGSSSDTFSVRCAAACASRSSPPRSCPEGLRARGDSTQAPEAADVTPTRRGLCARPARGEAIQAPDAANGLVGLALLGEDVEGAELGSKPSCCSGNKGTTGPMPPTPRAEPRKRERSAGGLLLAPPPPTPQAASPPAAFSGRRHMGHVGHGSSVWQAEHSKWPHGVRRSVCP